MRKISGYFSHFEIWNDGNASACDVTISLMDKDRKNWFEKKEVDVIRPNETVIFKPVLRARPEGEYCIECQYKNITTNTNKSIWKDIWLLFKLGYCCSSLDLV